MKQFTVEVKEVKGACPRGYRKGDRFTFNGLDTTSAFCGNAYTMLFPALSTLKDGADSSLKKIRIPWTRLACPDGGTVLFSVSIAE